MTRLRQRMREDMQVRNLPLDTQLSYLQQVSFVRPLLPQVAGLARARGHSDLSGLSDHEKKLSPG